MQVLTPGRSIRVSQPACWSAAVIQPSAKIPHVARMKLHSHTSWAQAVAHAAPALGPGRGTDCRTSMQADTRLCVPEALPIPAHLQRMSYTSFPSTGLRILRCTCGGSEASARSVLLLEEQEEGGADDDRVDQE